ncbi:MAG: ankyrin repeat domain-containing protein [Alphaproteobacteria bacterium]
MSRLYEAVRKNDAAFVRRELPHASDEEKRGVLVNAAELGYAEVVRSLLTAGVREPWAMAAAANFGRLDVLRLLSENGGGNRDAALIAAAAHGHAAAVRFLITQGASTLDEALADAALRGYRPVVKELLAAGANPQAPVYGGKTAVELAAGKGWTEIEALFRHGSAGKACPESVPDAGEKPPAS